MLYHRNWSILVATVLSLILFGSFVQAETPFDITACFSGERTVVAQGQKLRVEGSVTKGTWLSNHENKALNNMTSICAGILKFEGGKASGQAYCKVMDSDGDFIIMENTLEGLEITFKFLQGTGKWDGIKGEGKGKVLMKAKPITPDSLQSCLRVIGAFELAR
jgi:hypothetical protein